ncbi:MAG TPA: methyltransferase domain-containing protein [Candidatus Saccharimonadales bacterium]|nr:methyltransferase domain-containing protein [Candidatus Saccharimonadales bacterium]
MANLPDQLALWEGKHSRGEHENLRHSPSHFASIAERYFRQGSTIVELGCGVGRESEFFAKKGYRVLASDFSPVAIAQDKKIFKELDIDFSVHDMRQPLTFSDSSVDAVYANLALHYFDDDTTRKIFDEIWRILKPGGLLAFTCKSVNDHHFGNGEQAGNNVFISDKGHIRHLFSLDYTKNLLAGKFRPLLLEEVKDENDGQVDSLIRCVAKKIEAGAVEDSELFDIVDEHDQPTGQTVDRQTAHANAILHRCVAVYVFDKNGNLYIQDHHSGLFDHTVGGHVSAGEDYLPSAIREMAEEIGINDITLTKVITGLYSDEQFNPEVQQTRQRHMFGIFEAQAPAGWRFKPNEEVSGLTARPLKEVVDDMNAKPSDFTPGFINTMAKYLELKSSPFKLDVETCRKNWGRP